MRDGVATGTPTPVSFVHNFINYMGLHAVDRVDAGVGGTPSAGATHAGDGVVPDIDMGGASSNTDVVIRVPKKLKWLITVVVMGVVYASFEVVKLIR